MAQQLTGSVGIMGRNIPADVINVQKRLLLLGYKPGIADGICGRRTNAAILAFQGGFLKFPDGRIDPGGKSWKRLLQLTEPMSPPAVTNQPKEMEPTKLVSKPQAATINIGLSSPDNDFMIKKFGKPRETYSQNDQPITNASLLKLMNTSSVGPFRAYGMSKALDSLKLVFTDIQQSMPTLYALIGNSGMTVCRYQRGSTTKISNHSWGTAIDLNINKQLDARGDNMTQVGLLAIAPFFNKRQWYWGAGFPTEDSMHFECSRELLNSF